MAPQKEKNKLRRKLDVNITYNEIEIMNVCIALLTLTNIINDKAATTMADPLQYNG